MKHTQVQVKLKHASGYHIYHIFISIAKVPFWGQGEWQLWHVETWKNNVEFGLCICENVCPVLFWREVTCDQNTTWLLRFTSWRVHQSWQSKNPIDTYNGLNWNVFLRPHLFQTNYLSKDVHDGFKPDETNCCLSMDTNYGDPRHPKF